MKYLQTRDDGVVEIREDARTELPTNSIELSDEDFAKLDSNQYRYENGKIVAAPTKVLTS